MFQFFLGLVLCLPFVADSGQSTGGGGIRRALSPSRQPGTSSQAAFLDASAFGFSTADKVGSGNFAGLAGIEASAMAQGHLFLRFAPGIYKIRMPLPGEPGYLGPSATACMFTDLHDIVIDASKATFVLSNDTVKDAALFAFSGCSDVTLNFNFVGTHTNRNNGMRGIFLKNNNNKFNIIFSSNRMFEGIRVGNWEDPAVYRSAVFEGNQDIAIKAKCVDTYYAVPCYLTDKLDIQCESRGTASGGFAAYRAVYLNGCSNVKAVSRTLNLAAPDGVNIIGSGPQYSEPRMLGCRNVWLNATDLGSTQYVQYQSLVKFNIVSASTDNVSSIQDNINVRVDLKITPSVWRNNSAVVFGSLGASAAHEFKNITLSGSIVRTVDGDHSTVSVEDGAIGLSKLDITFRDFSDKGVSRKPLTLYIPPSLSGVKVTGRAYRSQIGRVAVANPAIQALAVH